MKSKVIIYLLAVLFFAGCKKDFLERDPLDELTNNDYWSSENNVETFSYGFYERYFKGYGAGNGWGNYFSGESLNDDFANTAPAQFVQMVPSSADDAVWTFEWVRRANVMLAGIPQVPMEEEAKMHWTGIARFFRAMEYHRLVSRFGDMPWYDQAVDYQDAEQLYKKRDPRTFITDKMLEDFQFAAENVRLENGEKGLTVNKDVVLAFMSRVFLFQGTWLKYHDIDQEKAKTYLEAAKWAANELILSGRYQLGPDYRSLFNALDLSTNPEMILYRKYATGILTHALHSNNNKESQAGISKNALENYLCADGLPVTLSKVYKGDKLISDVLTDRDPRMLGTVVPQLRLQGIVTNYSTSGYSVHKFLNESIKDLPEGNLSGNPTDAPVIRLGEILINYAEACAELGTITQEDLDKSINALRKRGDLPNKLPDLQVSGSSAMVNNMTYSDPKKDAEISSILWEVRRERRAELMMEGFRFDDLRRWKKLGYTDTRNNISINRGAWINKNDYLDDKGKSRVANLVLEGGGDIGYIIPAFRPESQRIFDNERVYLWPLPIDQITLYRENGSELKQNPGW
jgi:starch-binding outer membrane protein, SusD/RagB family